MSTVKKTTKITTPVDMIPTSISHDRLVSLRCVVNVAREHLRRHIADSILEEWDKSVKDAWGVCETLTNLHVRDAREHGSCERCAPEQFEHAKELAEFDAQLGVSV
jgi:uncharacterized paraquat-inducible protein A